MYNKNSIQSKFDNFKINNKNDKVIIYGAGKYSLSLFAKINLSGINVIGVVDKKYENRKNNLFFGIRAYPPDKLETLDYDTIFVFLENPKVISDILKKNKKLGKKIFLFNETKIPFEKYNSIILIVNGKERKISESELPPGFKITYTNSCRNNVLRIELPQNYSSVNVDFTNVTNCNCEIMSTKYCACYYIHFGESSNMQIKLNRNISAILAYIYTNQTESKIEIGEDCMLASDVKIVGGDGHSIYDLSTGKLINAQKNKLYVGNHVWLGDNSRIMKNAVISDGSVVGANTVVVKKYDEPNIILAGNPAKIIRHNIRWERDVITSLEQCISPECET